MDIIVDGYNLIGVDRGLTGGLEHKRNWLLQRITAYQELKKISVTVVFDGWQTGSALQNEEKRSGVRAIYSRLGEKADAVIVRIAREKGAGCVVVTSDREIRNAVERFGAVAIYSGEFDQILRSVDQPFFDEEVEEIETVSSRKGNSNRLSKSERRRQEKLRKLRL